jgi:hypothetical protein
MATDRIDEYDTWLAWANALLSAIDKPKNRKSTLAKPLAEPVLVRHKPVPMVPGNICPTCGCLLPTAADRAALRLAVKKETTCPRS